MTVRIFVEPGELLEGRLTLSGPEHHYLVRVRRQQVGESVCIVDGQGRQAMAEILCIQDQTSTLKVQTPASTPLPQFSLTMAPALIKGERMDQAITKMVELGVQHIRPITTEHTVVRLKGDRAQSRHARFASLVKAAARQSRNANPPAVNEIQSISTLLAANDVYDLKLIPEASGLSSPLIDQLPATAPASALVLVGPEGGFSPRELTLAKASGFASVSLGPRILRAETACIAIASILSFHYGDVGSR